MQGSRTKSSFNGIINEMPDVSVDNFERIGCKAYFLSHCHTDHTQGLFSEMFLDYLKRNKVCVYMSKQSAAIITHESSNKDIGDCIMPVKTGDTTIVAIPEGDENKDEYYISVSLIPAGHCFGSVMFLFKTLYKTILYTGDFRIGVNSVCKYSQLHENDDIIKLDALYVDTTFLNDDHLDFPKRTDSVDVVIRHIQKWLRADSRNQVALHTSANYGYEFVYNEIYKNTDEKVYVDEKRWELYSQFPTLVRGVTNDLTHPRIHRCNNRHETQTHEKCLPNAGHLLNSTFLYIHFSAYKWRAFSPEDSMIEVKKKDNKYRIDVCFATHCSKSELEYFVSYLAPKKVIGFPNEYVKRKDDSKRKLATPEKSPVKVPKLVSVEMMRALFND